MAGKKMRGRPPKNKKREISESESENEGSDQVPAGEYEQSREQRIKENKERMLKLGILDLSRNLKPPRKPHIRKNPSQKTSALALPSGSARRSSRLKTMDPISYSEKRIPMEGKKITRNVEININAGKNPEVYTEEHEKLLGDCKTSWTLLVDGFGEDGQRIYDQYDGKSCHQCRQKTLGCRTACSKCKSVQGQFCGDCLFMRYGENVLEVNETQDWICPVCRGICNCSRCRRVKGWEPTGAIYRKVINLGFKSVAHYLIQTRGPHGNREEAAGESPFSAMEELPCGDKEARVSELVSQLDDQEDENMKDDRKQLGNNPDQDYDYEPLDEDTTDDDDDNDDDDDIGDDDNDDDVDDDDNDDDDNDNDNDDDDDDEMS